MNNQTDQFTYNREINFNILFKLYCRIVQNSANFKLYRYDRNPLFPKYIGKQQLLRIKFKFNIKKKIQGSYRLFLKNGSVYEEEFKDELEIKRNLEDEMVLYILANGNNYEGHQVD